MMNMMGGGMMGGMGGGGEMMGEGGPPMGGAPQGQDIRGALVQAMRELLQMAQEAGISPSELYAAAGAPMESKPAVPPPPRGGIMGGPPAPAY